MAIAQCPRYITHRTTVNGRFSVEGELPAMIVAKSGLPLQQVNSYLETGDLSALEAIVNS